MKVLWLCNIILPEISNNLNYPKSNLGGWIVGLSNDIRLKDDIKLDIVFPFNKNIKGKVNSLNYYSFIKNPSFKYDINSEERFLDILKEVNPDIIHIWGTEFPHTLAMVNAAEKINILNKVVISIQGLCSYYSYHYFASIPNYVIKRYTFRDIIKKDNIKRQQKEFVKKGLLEKEAIKKVKHIIGRTDWDEACTYQINPYVNYHFCNETLRDSFYGDKKWNYEKCEKHTIFVSQAGYPIKGFHFLIKALCIILNEIPDTNVYVAGRNIIKKDSILDKLKITSYGKYIDTLIKKNNLYNKVHFLGNLNESQMKERYLKANVFVSPSSIENSPNSLGEAMILGVPSISSDVGGVKNLLEHNKEGFIYQHDAFYMLAYYIMKIFKSKELASKISKECIIKASKTHNKLVNLNKIIEIYNIINED